MMPSAGPGERAAAVWTGVFLFAVIAAYYLLRPLREEVGALFGPDRLLGLFVLTFAMIVVVNQPYSLLVDRLPVRRFLPIAMHLLASTFVVWAVVFALVPLPRGGDGIWQSVEGVVAALFFSWVTAFSVCATALVWVHAVDTFSFAQGRRWFGPISVGGTVGQVLGSAVDASDLALPRPVMALLAAGMLELSLVAWWLARRAAARMPAVAATAPVAADGGVWQGVALIARSRYLQVLVLFVLLSSVAATSFYYLGAQFVRADAGVDRRQFFATINFWSGVAGVVLQLFVTSRVLLATGIGVTLSAMVIYSLFGFAMLAKWPAAAVFLWIETARRTVQFAFDKPAREVLFTPLGVEAKYKAKALIDTVVLRAGDLVGALVNDLGRGGASWLGGPAAVVWIAAAWWLGRRCQRVASGDTLS